jgi:POTRA domain-containing FtsQ-type protein
MTKQQARLKSRSKYRHYEAHSTLAGSVRSIERIDFSVLLNARSVSIALLVIVIGLAIWLGLDDRFYVNSIKVTGNDRLNAADIVQKSGAQGTHIFWLKPDEVAQQLPTVMPSISSAKMSCDFPSDCTLSVVERQPIVAWQYGSAVTWIDTDRIAFAAEGKSSHSLITIVAMQGPALFPGQHADQQLIEAALAIAQALPEVHTYRYSPAHGLEFDDARGYPVYLGLGSNMADRVMVWRSLSTYLASRDITPKFVDVRYPTAPYYGE